MLAFAEDHPIDPWLPLPDGDGLPVDGPCAAPWRVTRRSSKPENETCLCPTLDPCIVGCPDHATWDMADCAVATPALLNDSGWGRMSKLTADASLKRTEGSTGLLCACAEAATLVPLVSISDHLDLRMTPMASAAPVKMTLRAMVKLSAHAEIFLGVSPPLGTGCTNACGTISVKATCGFSIPFRTPEIEEEIRRKGIFKEIDQDRSFCGASETVGVGAAVGATGLGLNWETGQGGRRLVGNTLAWYNFKAISCLIPPESGAAITWPFRLDLAADADATADGAETALATVSVETYQLAVELEFACMECSHPQVPQPLQHGGH